MAELEGGASGLVLASDGAPAARGYGIDLGALPTILDDVLVDAVRLTLEPSPARARDGRALAAYLDARATANAHITLISGSIRRAFWRRPVACAATVRQRARRKPAILTSWPTMDSRARSTGPMAG
jgi:hypothetical protein